METTKDQLRAHTSNLTGEAHDNCTKQCGARDTTATPDRDRPIWVYMHANEQVTLHPAIPQPNQAKKHIYHTATRRNTPPCKGNLYGLCVSVTCCHDSIACATALGFMVLVSSCQCGCRRQARGGCAGATDAHPLPPRAALG